MHYWCVLKWLLFVWLACLSHGGKLSSCKCRALYLLFGTFLLFAADAFSPSSFEPYSSNFIRDLLFFFFFDQTLAANASLCRSMHWGTFSAQTTVRTENESCGWLKCRAILQSKRVNLWYFLRPTKLRWSRKEKLREGTKTRARGWFTQIDLYRAS